MKQSKKITAKTKVKTAAAAKPASKAAKAAKAAKAVKAKITAAKPAKTPAKKVAKATSSATKTLPVRKEITTEIISARAYVLWEQAGRPQGRDVEFWVQAETQLKQETQALAA